MGFDIGPTIGIEGEKQFKNAVAGINKDMQVLGSELGKVAAQFGTNADSMEALRAKSEVYNKQIDTQKQKIEELKAALKNASESFGESDTRTKNWQISLNKAEAELAKTEGSLKQTTDQINNFGKESDAGGKSIESAGKKAKNSGDDAKAGESGWDKLGSGLKSAGEVAAKAALAIGAAALGAATGVAAMTTKAAANADEINTLAKQTGLSTEEIQKFQYASELIDVPMDTLTGSMAKLTKNMATAQGGTGDAAKAFAVLGISVTDSNGKLRDNQDVFNEAINALGSMENGTQRDAYAMQIFGKSAQDLNPLILGGADALKKYGDEADAAGLILGQDALDNLNSFKDSIDTFKSTLSGSGSLFATAFAGPMAEGMNTLTGYLKDLTGAFKEGGFSALSDKVGEIITDVIGKINNMLPKILDFGLNIIAKLVEGITQNIPALVTGATQILMVLVNTLLTLLPQLLTAALEIVKTLALGIADALPELIPAVVDTLLTIVDMLIENVDMLIDAALAIIMALAEGLTTALPKLVEKIPVIIIALVQAVTENLPKIIEAGISIIVTLAGALIQAIPQLLASIPQIVTAIVDAFAGYYSKIFSIGKNIVQGVWEGIRSMASWFADQVSGFFSGIVDGVKDFLGIASPSKVFAGIGEYMAQGLGKGFSNEMAAVAKQINASVPTNVEMRGQYQVEGLVNGLAGVMGSAMPAAGGAYTINVNIDGRTAASVLFDPLRNVARQRGEALA